MLLPNTCFIQITKASELLREVFFNHEGKLCLVDLPACLSDLSEEEWDNFKSVIEQSREMKNAIPPTSNA